VSFFPLIEIIPLFVATALSWFSSQEGLLAPKWILIYGVGAITTSYIHLFAVIFLDGFIMFGGSKKKKERKGVRNAL
jgi:hypothetical protein